MAAPTVVSGSRVELVRTFSTGEANSLISLGTFTVPAHGGNAILVCHAIAQRTGTGANVPLFNNIRHNGTSLTFEASGSATSVSTARRTRQEVWFLPLGSGTPSGNVEVSISVELTQVTLNLFVIQDAAQTGQPLAAAGSTATATGDISNTLTSLAANALALDFLLAFAGDDTGDYQSPLSGQGDAYEELSGSATAHAFRACGSSKANGGSAANLTMGWNYTQATSSRVHHAIVGFAEAPGGGTTLSFSAIARAGDAVGPAALSARVALGGAARGGHRVLSGLSPRLALGAVARAGDRGQSLMTPRLALGAVARAGSAASAVISAAGALVLAFGAVARAGSRAAAGLSPRLALGAVARSGGVAGAAGLLPRLGLGAVVRAGARAAAAVQAGAASLFTTLLPGGRRIVPRPRAHVRPGRETE